MTMTKKEIALKYKAELRENPTKAKAIEIAKKICKLKYSDGKPLSLSDKKEIISYIEEEHIDSKTGLRMIMDSDNTSFLDLVNVIRNEIK